MSRKGNNPLCYNSLVKLSNNVFLGMLNVPFLVGTALSFSKSAVNAVMRGDFAADSLSKTLTSISSQQVLVLDEIPK